MDSYQLLIACAVGSELFFVGGDECEVVFGCHVVISSQLQLKVNCDDQQMSDTDPILINQFRVALSTPISLLA
jgi:hypothetical protein